MDIKNGFGSFIVSVLVLYIITLLEALTKRSKAKYRCEIFKRSWRSLWQMKQKIFLLALMLFLVLSVTPERGIQRISSNGNTTSIEEAVEYERYDK